MKKKAKKSSRAKQAKRSGAKRAAMPKWQAAPPALVTTFETQAKALPSAEVRKMFGYPAGFTNGHMFAGVFQSVLFVRLGEGDRARLLAREGAAPFEPMPGRAMKEYMVLPPSVVASETELRQWLARALAYAGSLPPKAPR
jgi:TfoX/Sxy family transcriptional regulator of competence genes